MKKFGIMMVLAALAAAPVFAQSGSSSPTATGSTVTNGPGSMDDSPTHGSSMDSGSGTSSRSGSGSDSMMGSEPSTTRPQQMEDDSLDDENSATGKRKGTMGSGSESSPGAMGTDSSSDTPSTGSGTTTTP